MAPAGGGKGAGAEERTRRARATKDDGARAAIEARVEGFNSDWRELDRLIGEQFWRVAFHRVAEDEINYRRFFNINDLAGLRIEVGPVFAHAHARVFRMLESGEIDGLRIDHIDGLFDPKAYLEALRAGATPAVLSGRREDPGVARVVARRLAGRGHDRLRLRQPRAWSAGGLRHPSRPSRQAYRDLRWRRTRISRRSRATASCGSWKMKWRASSTRLAAAPRAWLLESPMTADLTRALLQRAIKQIVASFPVYRTYVDFERLCRPTPTGAISPGR